MVITEVKKESKSLQRFTKSAEGGGSFFVILSQPVLELAMGWKKSEPIEVEYDISNRRVIIHEAPVEG